MTAVSPCYELYSWSNYDTFSQTTHLLQLWFSKCAARSPGAATPALARCRGSSPPPPAPGPPWRHMTPDLPTSARDVLWPQLRCLAPIACCSESRGKRKEEYYSLHDQHKDSVSWSGFWDMLMWQYDAGLATRWCVSRSQQYDKSWATFSIVSKGEQLHSNVSLMY